MPMPRTQSEIQTTALLRLYAGGDWEVIQKVDIVPGVDPIRATSGRWIRREAYLIRDRNNPSREIWCGSLELQRYAGLQPDGTHRRDYLRSAQRMSRARRRARKANLYRGAFVVDDLPRKSGLRDLYVTDVGDTHHVSDEVMAVD